MSSISPFVLATYGAAIIAGGAALFGAGMSRLIWAEDLHNARELRQIWNKTEAALRSQIGSLERQVKILEGKP